MYGEGKGVMTTKDGDVIGLLGSGTAKPAGSDGTIHYRGAIYFNTAGAKYSKLNGSVGVHEYDVSASGSLTTKVWEWKESESIVAHLIKGGADYGLDQAHHIEGGSCGSGNGRRAACVCSAVWQKSDWQVL